MKMSFILEVYYMNEHFLFETRVHFHIFSSRFFSWLPQTDDKVCIVNMNQTAPSVLSPHQKRKQPAGATDAPPAKKQAVSKAPNPKAARKIEALVSPIPHRASVSKQVTPRKLHQNGLSTPPARPQMTFGVFRSPEYARDEPRPQSSKEKLHF